MSLVQIATDAVISQSVRLLRYEVSIRAGVMNILSGMQKELMVRLASDTLTGIARGRLNVLLNQATGVINAHYADIAETAAKGIAGAAQSEALANAKWLEKLYGDHVDSIGLPPPDHMKKLADKTLVFGAQAKDYWKRQGDDTAFRYAAAVRQGVAQGETNGQITQRITGTKTKPGVMQVSAGNARKLVHQSVQTVANAAHLESFRANSDVILGVRQVSTLDGKTSEICIAYDGQAWNLDGEPLDGTELPFNGGPPRHWNCRSVLVPITKSYRDMGIDIPEPAPVGRASVDGYQNGRVTFEQFLDGKPEAFVDELLGKGKAKLWRDGKITLQQLLDQSGNPLTLSDLLAKYA